MASLQVILLVSLAITLGIECLPSSPIESKDPPLLLFLNQQTSAWTGPNGDLVMQKDIDVEVYGNKQRSEDWQSFSQIIGGKMASIERQDQGEVSDNSAMNGGLPLTRSVNVTAQVNLGPKKPRYYLIKMQYYRWSKNQSRIF